MPASTLQNVDKIAVRVDVVQPARDQQALQDAVFGAQDQELACPVPDGSRVLLAPSSRAAVIKEAGLVLLGAHFAGAECPCARSAYTALENCPVHHVHCPTPWVATDLSYIARGGGGAHIGPAFEHRP